MEINIMKSKILKIVFFILIFITSTQLYAKEAIDEVWNTFWIATDYVDAFVKQDRQSLVIKYPDLPGFYQYDVDEYPYGHYEWYENERCIEGLFFYMGDSPNAKSITKNRVGQNKIRNNSNVLLFGPFDVLIDKFIFNEYKLVDDQIIIKVLDEDFSNNAAFLKKKDWKYNIDYEDEIKLILDGDYLKLYYWGNYMHTFCRLNDETYAELKTFLKTEKYDRSKVTWPRHADGSCDYDGSKKAATVQTTKPKSTTIVAQYKIMTVNENLKLRSGEATTTQVLIVMSVGTKVKILELGKEETIDGINSNWVKVEVISGRDRDGKDIKKKTTGWCYGGYLE